MTLLLVLLLFQTSQAALEGRVVNQANGQPVARALVIDERGRVIASATEEHWPFASPQIGWAEQDPRDWWRACGVAVHKALAQSRLRGDQISFLASGAEYRGRVNGNTIEGTVKTAGKSEGWKATR